MKKLLTAILFIIFLNVYSSVQVLLITQQGESAALLSEKKIEKKLKKIYPFAKFIKPKKVSEIKIYSDIDTLICVIIAHSQLNDERHIDKFGRLMIFLGDNEKTDYTIEEIKEQVLFSKTLHQALEYYKGRKLVIADVCFAESLYKKINKATWIFSTEKEIVNIISYTDNDKIKKGFIFTDKINIQKGSKSIDIVNNANLLYKQKWLYSGKVLNSDGTDGAILPTFEKPLKSKHYEETYIF